MYGRQLLTLEVRTTRLQSWTMLKATGLSSKELVSRNPYVHAPEEPQANEAPEGLKLTKQSKIEQSSETHQTKAC